ncbi:DUF4399 domain-containing protein [Halomonas elongata]|uniref:DUF4399 domain-containing protein n=2 Tax=Halomonas elongata TaxID=2746 RepID=E1V7X1_HALED|nr:DUF4399 domain-containing protein [Halomonas elongata]RAW07342.1 DUF4399 domain-containing protein [Halomonas elongata]WBF18773.1 DUF4399 domain-containing protein [Halomonas elongata]WPU47629.1 DUF4399 domain-containing protein [Halomonas elongata DSM 2581]WVI72285.1 DUF4399 domain-containing protein [Halomonas elongata]CBV41534.1 DUF4399 family protein [Halomonas elongata DSM 2581]
MQRLITTIAVSLFGSALMASSAMAEMEATAPAEGAEVYFISPQDGDTLSSPVTVRMGLEGMGVAPAGTEVENTGHHHLLIDKPLDEVDLSAPLPATEQTLHFGGGQTQTTLDLPPGEHTLQLLFMDYRHFSFDPPVHSEPITITVE